MYCRKCGKEVQGDAKFCPACGMTTGQTVSMTNLAEKVGNSLKFDITQILHTASMIIAAIIVLLAFSKWLRIDMWVIGGSYSPIGLFKAAEKLSKYGNGEIFTGISIFLIIITALVVLLAVAYISIAFLERRYCDNRDIIRNGKSLMLAIAIIYVICAGIAMTIETSQGGYEILQISFNKSFYAIIILSCVNRFLILPWYDKLLEAHSDKDDTNENENNSKLTELAEKWED